MVKCQLLVHFNYENTLGIRWS